MGDLGVKKLSFYEKLFVLAIATKPLYLTSSGSLQISDYLYMALFALFLLPGKISFPRYKEAKWALSFIVLIVYQFLVNIASYIVNDINGINDMAMITRIIYYIFNLFVCITIFQLYGLIGYKKLLKLYLLGSSISIVVCYIGVIMYWSGTGRVTGFFNNPNQLGYYAILMMTVFVVFCHEMPKKFGLVLIILCVVLNVFSLSKASLIGSAALIISYALLSSDSKGIKKTILTIITVLLVTMIIYMMMFSDNAFFTDKYYIMKMRNRLFNMSSESDTDLGTGRGYDRIKEIGALIVTGVGQGAYDRFEALKGKELHSTYASLIVSYGLIGFGGYCYLFGKAIFSNKRIVFNVLSMIGVMLYSITHNGIRSSLLWTLIVMLLLRSQNNAENQ